MGGYPIASGQGAGTSVGAYAKSANLITGRNQFLGKGNLQLIARGSAIGVNITLVVGGITLIDDLPVPTIGTTGAMSQINDEVCNQAVSGGVAEFYLRNTTVGALTCDYVLKFSPIK